MSAFLDLFLHLDKTFGMAVASYGGWVYAVLFLVVFCETGLVVTPFLPGDSLIFAAGAFAAAGSIDPLISGGLIFAAAVLGDAVNYRIGRKIGARAEGGRLLGLTIRQAHIDKTRLYYEKYGAKTIVLARFVPIVRTFAPFVAGIGAMPYAVFARYNILGAGLWVGLFLAAGYLFGNIPIIKDNFEIVILAIIFVSILPAAIGYLKDRLRR